MQNYNAPIYHHLSLMTKLIDPPSLIEQLYTQYQISRVHKRSEYLLSFFAVDVCTWVVVLSPHKCALGVSFFAWCTDLQQRFITLNSEHDLSQGLEPPSLD